PAHDALLAVRLGACAVVRPRSRVRRQGTSRGARSLGHEARVMSKIEFKSHVPVAQKPALEALLFFNSCQERVSACIADAIEKFGTPEIVADRDRLRIHMKELPEVQ